MKADLHIHSYLSDGKYSPAKVVQYSLINSLDIISLTDHDTIAGLQEARRALQSHPQITLIPGVEISTCLDTEELHILGYGINESAPAMQQLLSHAQARRRQRIERILDRLRKVGVKLTIEDVKYGNHAKSLGRLHLAHLLVRLGYTRTVKEAFDRYLCYQALKITPQDFVSSQHAIHVILEAGGIPVFAHPTIALFDQYIDQLIDFGLQGVEVFKSTRSSIEEFYFETVGKDKGLLLTGGSDWHGFKQKQPLGNFYVEAARIQSFLQAIHRKKVGVAE